MKVFIVTSNDYSGECHKNEAVFSTYDKAEEYCSYHSDCEIEPFEVDADYEKKETIWKVTFLFDEGNIQTTDNEYYHCSHLHTLHFMSTLDYCHNVPEFAPYLAIYVLADTIQHAQEKAKEIYNELLEYTKTGNHKDLIPSMRRCYYGRKYPIYDYTKWTQCAWYTDF